MGPSGAGKSTLMDILAQRKSTGHLGGAVLVDGLPAGAAFIRRAAYVPQFDNFVPVMTALEVGKHSGIRAEGDYHPGFGAPGLQAAGSSAVRVGLGSEVGAQPRPAFWVRPPQSGRRPSSRARPTPSVPATGEGVGEVHTQRTHRRQPWQPLRTPLPPPLPLLPRPTSSTRA